MKANTIIGADQGKRKESDFYPTPPDVTIALLDFLQIPKGAMIWEPACGQCDMAKVFSDQGYGVIATDIQLGVDFLTADMPECVDWIITNPPFSIADEFIERCTDHRKPFALLLKSQYWHAAKRRNLFLRYPPTYILPLTWRPDFTGQGASLMDVCWCVWDYKGLSYSLYKPLKRPKGEQSVSKQ